MVARSEIILSIVIPTRNRAQYLKQMFDSICPQILAYGKNSFQIVIANNASEDNTEQVVEQIKDVYGITIEYYRHIKNIGLQNLDFVASKAIGKYSLLSGDDDIYAPNFISTIMPFLDGEKEYSIIHWNRLEGDAECSNTRLYNPIYEKTIQSFDNPGDFLKTTLSATNFVSSLVYNTSCWKMVTNEDVPRDWDGYRTWGKILLGAAKHNKQCLFLFFPLVIQRNPSKEWASKWAFYAIYEISNIFESLDAFYPGLLHAWKERMHDTNYYSMKQMIDSVVSDIEYYRERQSKMEQYLAESEKRRLRMWLSASNPQRKLQNYHRWEQVKRIVSKLLG